MEEEVRIRWRLVGYAALLGALTGAGLSAVFNGFFDWATCLVTAIYFSAVGILVAIADKQRRCR
jgi:hypothetical protein